MVEAGNVSPDFEGGVAVADLVLAAAVTSVIAYNDMIALGLVSRFGARGVSVPDDVSIIGFDDIPASALVSPALTTVSQPKDQCGRAGIDLLVDLLNERERPGSSRASLPTRLIVRASTGPAAHRPDPHRGCGPPYVPPIDGKSGRRPADPEPGPRPVLLSAGAVPGRIAWSGVSAAAVDALNSWQQRRRGGVGRMDELVRFTTGERVPRCSSRWMTRRRGSAGRRGRDGEVVEAVGTFEAALRHVAGATEAALRVFRDGTLRPDTIEVDFGIKLTAEAGAVIAKTAVEGHLNVKVTWTSGGRQE